MIQVFIVTYNRAEYLRQSIKSVLNQTYSDFELIILDNCSDDSTQSVVESFKDKRIKYIRHEKNIGWIANLNYAFSYASEEIFVIFHDDDIMCPNFLEDEVSIFAKNSDVVLVAGNAIIFGDNPSVVAKNNKIKRIYRDKEYFSNYINRGETIVFPSLMYRKSFFDKYNIRMKEQVGPCADVVLCMDTEKAGGVICEIPEIVMNYRKHYSQLSERKKYPMHVQLFDYLSSCKTYENDFLNEVKGRQLKYNHFVKLLLLDYLMKRIDENEAKDYEKKLRISLRVEHNCVWNDLMFWSLKSCFIRSALRVAYQICKKHNYMHKDVLEIK